jgi:hypothetical protein
LRLALKTSKAGFAHKVFCILRREDEGPGVQPEFGKDFNQFVSNFLILAASCSGRRHVYERRTRIIPGRAKNVSGGRWKELKPPFRHREPDADTTAVQCPPRTKPSD